MRIRLRGAALVATLVFSGAALATPPSTGLGQSWPAATDVSTNPNFHAYVFMIGGIQYIQLNDLNGHVLGAVGNVGGGQYFVLPVGTSATQVSTPQQAAAPTSAQPIASPTQVYNDGQTQITATPKSDGTTALATAALCDPIDCNIKGAH